MGASILPVAVHGDTVYLLFGKERETDENPGWSDFGGGTESNESFLTTAAREGSEELTGFLGSASDIRRLLRKPLIVDVDFRNSGHSIYRVHLFRMPFDEALPSYFNNNRRFLEKRLPASVLQNSNNKIYEKTQLRWFTLDELAKRKKDFRSFYQTVVDTLLSRRQDIERFARQKKKTQRRRSRPPVRGRSRRRRPS